MWSGHFYLEKLQMEKSIFKQFGATYELQGDYFTPCRSLLTEKEKPVGICGEGVNCILILKVKTCK